MNENFKLDIKKRPRRLRKTQTRLALCEETHVSPSDLILPVFIKEGKSGADKIPSMPNVYRHTIDSLLRLCEKASKKGIMAIA
ncbi:MAG: porphobilinogen synthase, partial [Opitutales bacterium]|nr:porphobilinogen synthase [Opitutales bacterium]